MEQLIEILDNITPEPTNAIYISIGSAAHMRQLEHKLPLVTNYLPDEHNQQIPSFLKTLISTNPEFTTHIFLIDPCLENPPYCVRTNHCKHNGAHSPHQCFSKLNKKWQVIKPNVYNNPTNKIWVYTFNIYVKYLANSVDTHIDITDFFDKLNYLAKLYKWFVVTHDFSGRNIQPLALYYEKNLGSDQSHIIYGLGMRDNIGSYMDLTSPLYNFVYIMHNEEIRVFNPYIFNNITELDRVYREISADLDSKTKLVADSHYTYYLSNIIKIFNTHILTPYRKIYIMNTSGISIKLTGDDTMYISSKYSIQFDLSDYNLLAKIFDVLVIELEKLFNFFNLSEKINECIQKIKCEKDPYKFYSIISSYMKQKIKN